MAHYTYSLSSAIARKDVHCSIYSSKSCTQREVSGVDYYPVFDGFKTRLFKIRNTFRTIAPKPDVIHWQSTTHPRLLLQLMSRFSFEKALSIYTVHNVLPHERPGRLKNVYSKLYRRMDGLIFHSLSSKKRFANAFPGIIKCAEIIPHGAYDMFIDNEERAVRTDGKTVLFFGNIRRYKGLDVLINAFAIVHARQPAARLKIVGQALDSFRPYSRLIRRLNLESAVEISLGYLPDSKIRRIFETSSIVALPYRSIDQSGVLMLAMAFGKAIVASDIGGMGEVIRDGINGILVTRSDYEDLARKILFLLENPEKAKRLGANSFRDSQTVYSWEMIAERTMDFYKRVKVYESK